MTCHTDLTAPSTTTGQNFNSESVISPEEQRFWERMTFREFTILFLRLQALWLLFNAAIEVTYLPSYFIGRSPFSSFASGSPALSSGFFLVLFRIILHVAAALAVVQFSGRIVSWFAKDLFSRTPNPGNKSIQASAVTPMDTTQE